MMGCILNPLGCVQNATDSLIGLFPYGLYGVVGAACLIIGAILGKVGVSALFALVAAIRFGSRDEFTGEIADPDPKLVPVPRAKARQVKPPQPAKRRPTLLDLLKKRE